jgi:hypothetical protein
LGRWSLDDIDWARFEPSRVDPEILRMVKAASLVERNGGDYAHYLCNVFADDPVFQDVARRWGEEEIQHGEALGRWAALADPDFDHRAACARFTAGFRVPLDAARSVRGTRSGELVARCIVETGTSSYYSALAEATSEPVLRQICHNIAADEFRHYKLFYTHLKRYLARERLGFWGRLRVALGRLAESEDDELAFAYHAANQPELPYDRRQAVREYGRRAYALVRRHHIERGVAMILKAVGLKPNGRLGLLASRVAWWNVARKAERFTRAAT